MGKFKTCIKPRLLVFCVLFFAAMDRTQGLTHARHVFHHCATLPVLAWHLQISPFNSTPTATKPEAFPAGSPALNSRDHMAQGANRGVWVPLPHLQSMLHVSHIGG